MIPHVIFTATMPGGRMAFDAKMLGLTLSTVPQLDMICCPSCICYNRIVREKLGINYIVLSAILQYVHI